MTTKPPDGENGAISAAPAGFGERARDWLLAYPRAIPLALFLAIAAITALSVYSIETGERAREEAAMRTYAQNIATSMERRGNSFSSYLRAGAALFSSVDEVSPRLFQQFVSELRLNLEYKGAEGIGWAEYVPRTEENAFLARMRDLDPDYPAIRPKSDAALPRLALAAYFSPDSRGNSRLLGFNMYSSPVLAEAMDEARRTVRPTASGGVVSAAGQEKTASGFVIFMPVYNGEPSTRDAETSLAGFVYSPFHADRFLSAALETDIPEGMGVRLFDSSGAAANEIAARPVEGNATRQIEQTVSIANRELRLVVESDHRPVLAPLSMVTLLFGLAVASLLMLLARLLTLQVREDRVRLRFFEEQHSIRNSLTRELNHRVKNSLANVLSILSLTRRRSTDLDEFADNLEGRIRSLSATHDLLTQSDWGTTAVRSVIEAELQHFSKNTEAEVVLEGPMLELAPNDALSLGLAVHELTTNAAKFGALSVANGRVEIRWELLTEGLAEIDWRETGGPGVTAPVHRGFGTDLIEKIVAHELKQPVKIEFADSGVRCVLRLPVRRRSEFQIRQAAKGDTPA